MPLYGAIFIFILSGVMTKEELIEFLQKPTWSQGFHNSNEPTRKDARETLIELTSNIFNNESATLAMRRWHFLNDYYDIPACETCGTPTKWQNSGSTRSTYGRFCSPKCIANSPEIANKKQQTSLERYGHVYSFMAEEQQEKRTNTIIEKFGTENFSDCDSVKEKKKATVRKKYGVDQVLSLPSTHAKKKATVRKKYGVDYITQVPEIQERIKNTNLEKYGFITPLLTPEFKEYYKQISLERYGTEWPSQSEIQKEKFRKKVADGELTWWKQEHISLESMELLNDCEWLKEQHYTNKRFLYDIAEELGVHGSTVANYLWKCGLETKHYFYSRIESIIENLLKDNSIEYITNDRNLIKPYELDFYIPSKNIAIEVNGVFWHSDAFKKDDYHKMKYDSCKQKGVQLIQIYESELYAKEHLVLQSLASKLGISNSEKIYARKCFIKLVDTKEKRQFFEDNHIQGDGPSSINYGLYYDSQLVACIGFIKQKDHFVLNRYATSCNVVGGFTKLLTHFEREYDKPRIVTFADLRWSEGELYKKTGFVLDKELAPDYGWVKRDKIIHKFNFRHTTGLKKLPDYDPNLSESENMHNHRFYKIFDAGKLRFIKNG